MRAILILSQYGCKEKLEEMVADAYKNVKNVQKELNQMLEATKNIAQKWHFKRIEYKATGRVGKTEYVREDELRKFIDVELM